MLSEKQVKHYKEEGYVVVEGFLSPDQLESFKGEMAAATDGQTVENHDASRMEMEPGQGPEGTVVRRLYEPCSHYAGLKAFSRSARLLDCVEALLGPDLVFHYSKINMKPAGIGSVVEWHQDLSYYPLTNRDSVSILFYLDEARVENGCLQVLPRCHRESLLSHNNSEGYFQGRVTEALDEAAAVPLEGGPGTVIFMDAMTPHSSVSNTSDKPRRTLILSYRAADAYPIFTGPMTPKNEVHTRLVRGQHRPQARFAAGQFPIPQYKDVITSLYDLQARSRGDS